MPFWSAFVNAWIISGFSEILRLKPFYKGIKIVVDNEENERIDKIGKVIKRCDYVLPDGVEIVDAKGQYVAPGLIDIHNHADYH